MGTTTVAARAALLAKRAGHATYQDPARSTDAGRVLAAIKHAPGLPTWAIARNAHMPLDRVKYACQYLRQRAKIFRHRTEYLSPKHGVERVQSCWFPGAKPNATPIIDRTRCQMAMGFGRVCGTRLEDYVTGFGRVITTCPACERRNRGLCRSCPRPTERLGIDGPAPWYCASCAAARRRQRANAKCLTPEAKQRKAITERARIARCKAEGKPYRYDRPLPNTPQEGATA